MYVKRYLALLLLAAFAAGCGSDADRRRLVERSATEPGVSVDEIYAKRFALEDFWNRLDAAKSFYATDNRYLFAATRDSLVADVNTYIRRHPHMEMDPDFESLLNQLSILDTLQVLPIASDDYTAREDSLALEFADWPDLELELDDGRIFKVFDTDFPRIENRRIDFWINYFTGPGRKRFERAVTRMQHYRPTVESILTEVGLPPELICVALIESGFSMTATSYAYAVGPWQFIRGTGRLYGLRNDWWFDERRDIVASTYAAAHYLRDLYGIWNDWSLALAAYNCGEYRVARQIGRQRTQNFWRLNLPRQTERYVPKFLAALYILREPEKYDFERPLVLPFTFDQVMVKDATDLEVIAECAQTSVERIRELNPQLKRWATPPNTEVVLRVPKGKGELFEKNLARIPEDERITWRRHVIKRGETLSVIARKYGTTIATLKKLNGIRNSHRIREGKALVVPMKGGDFANSSSSKPGYMNPKRSISREHLERVAKRSQPPPGHKRLTYTVKRHDTLGHIAEAYNTSARKLRAWNNLSYRRYIYPGQKLAIYVPESFTPPDQVPTSVAMPDESSHSRHRHVVEKGETFYSISKKYRVRLDELLAWNNKSARSIIHPGDVLTVWKRK
jgi:membrane-bound lytic murein transglycosylase D